MKNKIFCPSCLDIVSYTDRTCNECDTIIPDGIFDMKEEIENLTSEIASLKGFTEEQINGVELKIVNVNNQDLFIGYIKDDTYIIMSKNINNGKRAVINFGNYQIFDGSDKKGTIAFPSGYFIYFDIMMEEEEIVGLIYLEENKSA